MKAVIVNGQVTVRDDVLLPVFAGQPIRFPVEPTGRFQPVGVNTWLGSHAISVPGMDGMDDTGAAAIEKR